MGWQQGIPVASLLEFLLLTSSFGNQMDPHVFPNTGPFCESWYLRIIDHHQNISLGFMFGSVLPPTTLTVDVKNPCSVPGLQPLSTDCKRVSENQCDEHFSESKYESSTPNLVFVGLFLGLSQYERLRNPEGFFNSSQYNITLGGKPVVRNPDDESPPHFEVKIGSNFSWVITSDGSKFSVIVGNHVLQGETMKPVPWGPQGDGPEGWLSKLPLPIHWFVYSLMSTVKSYEYVNKETGTVIRGGEGEGIPVVAHLEKNWGRGFPKAWVWSEGVDPRSEIAYAFSAGLVTAVIFDIKAQLSGYRNPRKQINCSFSPSNSLHSLHYDGCAGTAMLKVEGFTCAVTFQVSAPLESFSSCLAAPMENGFEKGCVHSYIATANITVYQRVGFSMVLTDNQIIPLSALEFGNAYMCNGQCPVE